MATRNLVNSVTNCVNCVVNFYIMEEVLKTVLVPQFSINTVTNCDGMTHGMYRQSESRVNNYIFFKTK